MKRILSIATLALAISAVGFSAPPANTTTQTTKEQSKKSKDEAKKAKDDAKKAEKEAKKHTTEHK